MQQPVRVAITGAAGNIGYAMAFRIAAGDMLGPEQPVILQLSHIQAQHSWTWLRKFLQPWHVILHDGCKNGLPRPLSIQSSSVTSVSSESRTKQHHPPQANPLPVR